MLAVTSLMKERRKGGGGEAMKRGRLVVERFDGKAVGCWRRHQENVNFLNVTR